MADNKGRGRGNGKWQQCTLVYPGHAFRPEDLLTFVEMTGFYDEWCELGLTDDDLWIFQTMIMAAPKSNPVVNGTGGFRVLTMARGGRPRQAVNVGYVYFEDYGIVLLVIVRSDNALKRLSPNGRASIRRLIERQAETLSRGIVR
jgi:hypothetical protein